MKSVKHIPVITIDGPSGTGKGTLCHLLAQQLGWHFLDSGVIYRALAFAAVRANIDWQDIPALIELANHLNLSFYIDDARQSQVRLDNETVSQMIRSELCGQNASKIAAIPEVRQALLARQRAFAEAPGLVTDGRDMGTVVFPEAILKVYLDASVEERAMRRYRQLQEQDIDVSLELVIEELTKRDTRDMSRSHAPLKAAADAVVFDTSGLTIVQVLDNVLQLARERLSSQN